MLIHTTDKKSKVSPRSKHTVRASWNVQHPHVQQILHNASIQQKIAIGTSNDKYEQEADRVANRLIQHSEPQLSTSEGDPARSNNQPANSETAQPAPPSCPEEHETMEDEEQEEVSLQAKAAPEVTPVSRTNIQPNQITGLKTGSQQGQGDPLPPSFCEEMEHYFCQDFSSVRVHTNAASASLSRSLQARAFTQGSDIFFNSGQYNPLSSQGKHLIAHELTHVVQQSLSQGADNPIQREFDPYYLTSSSWDQIRDSGVELAAGLNGIRSIIVITQQARVFDPTGRRLGTFEIQPGIYFPPGIYLLSGPTGIQLGRTEGQFDTRTAHVMIDPDELTTELSEEDNDQQFIENILNIPAEETSEIVPTPILMLVAGQPGSRGEELGQAGGEEERDQQEGTDTEHGRFAPDFTLSDAAGRAYQYPAITANIHGLATQPVGGTGIYTMNMHYSESARDLLGQVAWAFLPVAYHWEVWNVTGAHDVQARDTAIRQGDLAGGSNGGQAVGRFEGTSANFERASEALEQRPAEIRRDRDEAMREGRYADVIANELNDVLLPLEVISTYGGQLIDAFSDTFSDARERQIPWREEGTYIVRCIAVIEPNADPDQAMRAPSVATQVVQVRNLQSIASEELDRASADVAELELRLQLLELLPEDHPDRALIPLILQQLEERNLVASGLTTEIIEYRLTQAREALARRRVEASYLLEAGLHDSRVYALERQVEELEDQLALARERLSEINQATGASAYRVHAVLVSEVTGQTYPMILQIGEPQLVDGEWQCMLSDVTSRDGGTYVGVASQNEANPNSAATLAIWEAIERFSGAAGFGKGALSIRLPSNGWFSQLDDDDRERVVESRERDWTSAQARLEELGTAIALLGLVVTSPVLGIAGGLLSASLAGSRIAQRISNGTFRWDSQTTGDIIDIVGFAASMVGAGSIGALNKVDDAASAAVAVPNSSRRVRGFFLRTAQAGLQATRRTADVVEELSDIAGVIHCNAETAANLISISNAVASGQMSATEGRRARARTISGAIQSNGLTIASRVRSAQAPHAPESDAPSRRPSPEAEQPMHHDQPAAPETGTRVEPTIAAPETSQPPRTHHQLGEMNSELGDLSGRVPVVENPSLPGNTVEVVYRDGRLRVEVGPDATPRHVRYHQETVRQLYRYEGLMGVINILISRIQALLGGGPGFGDRGFEAGLEVSKLSRILNDLEALRETIDYRATEMTGNQADALSGEDGATSQVREVNPAERSEIDAEIASIREQLAQHQHDINSIEGGRGRVAMADTTVVPLRPEDEGFHQTLEVGESRVYQDLGGNVGRATRETNDITVIEAELQAGQTTPRGEFQRDALPAPEIDSFPIGRGGFERLHASGPLLGHESPHGILWGPYSLNRHFQQHGVEIYIALLREQLPPGATLHLTVIVQRELGTGEFAGVEFLKNVSYIIDSRLAGETALTPVFRQDIDVEQPQNPDSSYDISAPRFLLQDPEHGRASGTDPAVTSSRRQRRRPDIRPVHEQVQANILFGSAQWLVTALRGLGTSSSDERRGARAYASILNDDVRRIRTGERMTQDEAANIRQQISDILDVYPQLRPQYQATVDRLTAAEE